MLSVKAKAKNIPPERTLVVPDFVERIYLPWVEEHKRPSTLKSYQDIWKAHLKPILVRDRVLLRDVRTSTVQNWLNQIGQQDLSKNSLKRIQSLISGIFKVWPGAILLPWISLILAITAVVTPYCLAIIGSVSLRFTSWLT